MPLQTKIAVGVLNLEPAEQVAEAGDGEGFAGLVFVAQRVAEKWFAVEAVLHVDGGRGCVAEAEQAQTESYLKMRAHASGRREVPASFFKAARAAW